MPTFDIDAGFELPELGGRPLAPRTFTSTYFDTPGRRLLRSGITLRRRVENRKGVWQLTLPLAGGACHELEVAGGPAGPPEPILRLLPASLRGSAPEPVARLRTERTGVAVGPRADRIDVVLDSVAVLEGNRVASRFGEVEAEVVKGGGERLAAIGKALRKAGARRGDGTPTLGRILPHETAPAPDAVEPDARLRELLGAQYLAVLTNDPGVRLGIRSESLHQMRVGTRRARALLRAGGGLVDTEWAEPLQAELKWLAGLLGPVRDLDVLLEHLDDEAAQLQLVGDDAKAFRRLRARLAAERDTDRAALLEAMDGDRYFRLLDVLEHAADAPPGEAPASLEAIAGRAFARLRKTVDALPTEPADEELHAVRIQAKRARYAAELAAPELGKAGARLLERARELQDVIGDHQDACVAEDRLRTLALRGGGKTGLTAGRLIEREQRRKRVARKDWPVAWARLDKAARKAF